MSVAVEIAEQEAARAARGLAADGYKADFTVAGLTGVDRFLDDHAPSGMPKPGGLLAEHTGGRLFAIAAYVGEAARRALRGTRRHPRVADADTGRSVELTLMPDEAIAVHHPPALTPVVEACGRTLGYTVVRMDLPPITLPTASPPSPSEWWGKVRRFLGLGSRPTASRE